MKKPRKSEMPGTPPPAVSKEHKLLAAIHDISQQLLVAVRKYAKILLSSLFLGIAGIVLTLWIAHRDGVQSNEMHEQTSGQIESSTSRIIDSLSRRTLLLEKQLTDIKILAVNSNLGIHKVWVDSLFKLALHSGSPEQAEKIYTQILAKVPCSEAYVNRAVARRYLKKTREALDDYAKALELDPENATIYLSRGIFYFFSDDLDEAESDINRTIELEPDNTTAYRHLSHIFEARGQLQKALDILYDPRIRDSRDFLYLATRCSMSIACKRYDSATEDVHAILKQAPNAPEAYMYLGDIHCETGNYDAGIAMYTQGIQYATKGYTLLFLHLNRAHAYVTIGAYDQAITDYLLSLEIVPDNYMACEQLSVVYSLKKEYDKALKYLDMAEASYPYKVFRPLRIMICVNTQSTDSTLRYCLSLKKEYPQEAAIPYYVAMLHFAKNNQPKGIKFLREALQLNPEYITAHMTMGDILFHQTSFRQAIEVYTKVLEIDANYAKAYYDRGRCYVELQDYTHAFIDFTAAIELNPQDPYPYIHRGACYLTTGETRQALENFQTALKIGPEEPDAYSGMALYYEYQDDEQNYEKYTKLAAELQKNRPEYGDFVINNIVTPMTGSYLSTTDNALMEGRWQADINKKKHIERLDWNKK